MAAVATFLNRNRWIELPRDPQLPALGRVRWELDAEGELRTDLESKNEVRGFSWGLVVRGFDVDEGQLASRSRAVLATELQTERLGDADDDQTH
jgi:hypothetical protein